MVNIKKTYIIAVDPDVDKSGVAVLDTDTGNFPFVGSLPFVEVVRLVSQYIDTMKVKSVIVEGGWFTSHNWHIDTARHSKSECAKIGLQTGRNHETGRKLVECFEGLLEIGCVKVVKPLAKFWKGKDGKITSEELACFTGYQKRTNQDQRDAMLLAWVSAGLPVRKSAG